VQRLCDVRRRRRKAVIIGAITECIVIVGDITTDMMMMSEEFRALFQHGIHLILEIYYYVKWSITFYDHRYLS